MAEQAVRRPVKPIVHGFFVCREVFKDVRTGEFILIGPTTHFRIAAFPGKLPVMGFLQMVEAHGHYRFSASLLNPEEEVAWRWSSPGSLYHPEPLIPHQVVFHEWVLNVPRPGRYRLELAANGEELVSQALFMGPAELFLRRE